MKARQLEMMKIFKMRNSSGRMPIAVSWVLIGMLTSVSLVSCSSSEKNQEKSARDKYEPVYQASGAFDAAIAGAITLMMSSPQAGSNKEKDQIAGQCKFVEEKTKKQLPSIEACNGVEVFLYTPDGRILQRTWAFDGAYRFKVATAGPYLVKARLNKDNVNAEAEWNGVRRGQRLNIELIKK